MTDKKDNVISLNGNAVDVGSSEPVVNKELVTYLETLLQEAKDGVAVGFMGFSLKADGMAMQEICLPEGEYNPALLGVLLDVGFDYKFTSMIGVDE